MAEKEENRIENKNEILKIESSGRSKDKDIAPLDTIDKKI